MEGSGTEWNEVDRMGQDRFIKNRRL